jgi:hypothetical protein
MGKFNMWDWYWATSLGGLAGLPLSLLIRGPLFPANQTVDFPSQRIDGPGIVA